jgi:hypothetical protein
LYTILCTPYSTTKSWEPCSFTEVPDCPQIQIPNIIWIQKVAHIQLIRYAVFPEPSICVSKVLENEPPPDFPTGALVERVSRAFFNMSLKFLIKVLLIK